MSGEYKILVIMYVQMKLIVYEFKSIEEYEGAKKILYDMQIDYKVIDGIDVSIYSPEEI